MYRERPKRDENGKILYQAYQSKALPNARIQPDRRWFGNVHTVGQKQLEKFREEMEKSTNNPRSVLLKYQKVPWGLLSNDSRPDDAPAPNLLQTETYESTFGKQASRKRPRLMVSNLEELMQSADNKREKYDVEKDRNIKDPYALRDEAKKKLFEKGQSKRIWGELWKVVDSSDVIIEVLDSRDPMGTRCKYLEDHVKKNLRHKHLVLVLNKCDLVPTWATAHWVRVLSQEFPTLAFHASMTNPFGKGSLIQLLRQFAALHPTAKQISVGFIGYPNAGKSSIINTLRGKRVCKVAPIPGETKNWQYITLMKRIYLIDCPGVVYDTGNNTDVDCVLKGVVRVENLRTEAVPYVNEVLKRVRRIYLQRYYNMESWSDDLDFLAQLARKKGKLLKKGEPDLNTVAKMVLNDWQRGRLPYFTLPPREIPLSESESQTATTVIVPNLPQANTTTVGDAKQDESADAVKKDKDDATDKAKPADETSAGNEAENGSDNEEDDGDDGILAKAQLPPQEIKITQHFSKITVRSDFDKEDTEVPEGLEEEESDDGGIDWDEVYNKFQGKDLDEIPDVIEESGDEDDDSKTPIKKGSKNKTNIKNNKSKEDEEDEEGNDDEEVDEDDNEEEDDDDEVNEEDEEKEADDDDAEEADDEPPRKKSKKDNDIYVISEHMTSLKQEKRKAKQNQKEKKKKAIQKISESIGGEKGEMETKKKRRRGGKAARKSFILFYFYLLSFYLILFYFIWFHSN